MSSNWSSDYQHPKWQKKKGEILARDNHTCMMCGDTETLLHVHHGYYGKHDTKIWDVPDDYLWTLCKKCHDIADQQLHEIKRYVGQSNPSKYAEIIDTLQGMGIEGEETTVVNISGNECSSTIFDSEIFTFVPVKHQSNHEPPKYFLKNKSGSLPADETNSTLCTWKDWFTEKNLPCDITNYDFSSGNGRIANWSVGGNLIWVKEILNHRMVKLEIYRKTYGFLGEHDQLALLVKFNAAKEDPLDDWDLWIGEDLDLSKYGLIKSVESYLPDGSNCPHTHVRKGNGIFILWHPDGNIRLRGFVEKSLPTGIWEQISGDYIAKGEYKQGSKVGWHEVAWHTNTEHDQDQIIWKKFYGNGGIGVIEEIKYLQWNRYYRDGEERSERRYDHLTGEMNYFCFFDEDQQKHGWEVEHFPSGKVKTNRHFSHGKPHGPWIVWGENDELDDCYLYKNGRLFAQGKDKVLKSGRRFRTRPPCALSGHDVFTKISAEIAAETADPVDFNVEARAAVTSGIDESETMFCVSDLKFSEHDKIRELKYGKDQSDEDTGANKFEADDCDDPPPDIPF